LIFVELGFAEPVLAVSTTRRAKRGEAGSIQDRNTEQNRVGHDVSDKGDRPSAFSPECRTDLVRLISELHVPIFMLRLYHVIDLSFIKRAHAEHSEIAEYLLRADGRRAERAMRKHIRSTKATVLDRTALPHL
jgi:hypothetical protein